MSRARRGNDGRRNSDRGYRDHPARNVRPALVHKPGKTKEK